MPRRSRRALLELLGTGTAALLAGCQGDPPSGSATDRPTRTASRTETPASIASETAPGTGTPAEPSEPADCAAVPRPEVAWPVPRRSPARDGYVADPVGFDEAPTLAWEAEASAPDDSYASPSYGQPVVGHDRVYLVNLLDNGPQRPMYGHVHALDAESGDRRWTSERLRSPSHPVVWGDQAVVVAETESLDAMVVAFDWVDGTRRWTREFAARDSGFVTAGDHLYLALEEATDRGTVRALGADGTTAWSREGALADHVNEGPTVGTDHLYVATREGRLHALDRDDGTAVWNHRFEHPTERQPYVTDLVATDCAAVAVVEGAVKALDDGGDLVWEVDGEHGSVATDGAILYVASELDDGRELRALDVATGELRWTVGGPVETLGTAIVAGDDLYVHVDESVAALNRSDGTERWRTEGSLRDLALADGTLFGTRWGTLRALR